MPYISVILPVYNVEDYIEQSLQSFVEQTFQNFEIIIVNDGTKDNSIIKAKKFLKKSRLKYLIVDKENGGVSSARNRGIKEAKGEWVICVDPDDCLCNTTFEMFSKFVSNNPNINACGIGFKSVTKITSEDLKYENDLISNTYEQSEIIRRFLCRTTKILSPGLFLKRDFILDKGLYYDEKIKFSEDVFYVWNVLFNIDFFGFIENNLYLYLRRSSSTMNSSSISKILTGYYAYLNFDNNLPNISKNNNDIEQIFPRWLIAIYRATSRYLCWNDFEELLMKTNYKVYIKRLKKFPDLKIRIMSKLLLFNSRFYYLIVKKI